MTQENTTKTWPITMTEAAHISRIPRWKGSDADVAREFRCTEELVRQIRDGEGYNGVNLP